MKIPGLGILIILFSTMIALSLSISSDMEDAGLGGLYNLILAPFVGTVSLIIFLLVCWITKNKKPLFIFNLYRRKFSSKPRVLANSILK
ncbi:MAG TPA: hypothetical protein PKA85_09550 [Ferruginibacter sp.]|nr:hypothetical protein [Ferruginibacter sp.]